MTICIQPVYSMGWGRVLRCPPVAGPWLGGLGMHPPTNTILVYIIYRYVLNIYLSLSNDHCALSQAHCWFENQVSFPTTTMPLSLGFHCGITRWGRAQLVPIAVRMGATNSLECRDGGGKDDVHPKPILLPFLLSKERKLKENSHIN